MSAREYYALGDAERRRYGIPPIDHAVYTDLNARVIKAYVRMHEAGLGDDPLAVAERSASRLLQARQRADCLMAQAAPNDALANDDRMRAFDSADHAYLEPQGPFGLALLALHSATGDDAWLAAAERIAEGLGRLEDPERGGFFASDDTSTADIVPRRRPYDENVEVTRFLVRLSWVLHDEAMQARAERTLRAVASEAQVGRLGSVAARVARALEELQDGAVDFTVVGDRTDARARPLFEAAVRVYEPRKVVRYEAAGVRSPDQGRPAMFVCTPHACSSPITDPAEVAEAAARMARVPDPDPCAARR